ncbi:MAG: hypothetical protein ACHQIF_15110, partial [Steroidobacterales bacterium]
MKEALLVFGRVELGGELSLELGKIRGGCGGTLHQEGGNRPQDAGEPNFELVQLPGRDATAVHRGALAASGGGGLRGGRAGRRGSAGQPLALGFAEPLLMSRARRREAIEPVLTAQE